MIEKEEVEACKAILGYVLAYNRRFNTNTPLNEIWFRYDDVGVHWRLLDKLERKGLIALKFRTNSGRHFVVPDIEKVKAYIQMYQQQMQALEPSLGKEHDFSNIVGHEKEKLLVKAALETLKNNGWPIHFLFVGPPGSAKSMFLVAFVEAGGKYDSMVTATKAGIRDLLIADVRPYLCVDEIDKASREDTEVFLEILQRGTTTITKSGNRREVEVRKMMVIGTANDIEKVGSALRDRFISIKMRELSKAEKVELTGRTMEEYHLKPEITPPKCCGVDGCVVGSEIASCCLQACCGI